MIEMLSYIIFSFIFTKINKIVMKHFIYFLLAVFSLSTAFGQVSVSKSTGNSKWQVGGGFGISTGNNSYFGLNISPTVGYIISNNLEVGMSAGYQYGSNSFSSHNLFSAGPYINAYLVERIFGKAHYEYFTGNYKAKNGQFNRKINENAMWLGAGYQSSGPVRFQVGIMYNVLHNNESIFSSAIRPIGGISVSL